MGRFSEMVGAKNPDREKAFTTTLLGRYDAASAATKLAKARFVVQAREHSGFATDSEMCCKLYESEDDCGRAGVVLSLTTITATSAVLPHAEVTEAGLDLHLGGAEECRTMIRVLVRALLRSSFRNIILREAAIAFVDSFAPIRDERDYEPEY